MITKVRSPLKVHQTLSDHFNGWCGGLCGEMGQNIVFQRTLFFPAIIIAFLGWIKKEYIYYNYDDIDDSWQMGILGTCF